MDNSSPLPADPLRVEAGTVRLLKRSDRSVLAPASRQAGVKQVSSRCYLWARMAGFDLRQIKVSNDSPMQTPPHFEKGTCQ